MMLAALYATAAKAQTITTYAGDFTKAHTFSGDGAAATAAGLDGPTSCTFDAAGNFYFSDKYNGSIRKVDASGNISTPVGTGSPGTSGDGGPATAAQLDWPIGLNFDGTGNLYIAVYNSHNIRMVNTAGNISTFAGTSGVGGFAGDGGAATASRISFPTDVVADAAGNVYISDWNNGLVRKVDGAGIISTYAGGGTSFTDGIPATDASFYANNGVYADAGGNLFITDMDHNRLCKVNSGALCYTILGDGTAGYSGDGAAATAARCDGPAFVTLDAAGNVFFSDMNNQVIRRIEISTGNVSTVVGTGTSSYTGDGGAATAATLSYPTGMCFNKAGDLFICDQGNNVVRKVTAAAVGLSGTTTVCKGNTTTLSAAKSGGVWSSSNTAVATVSATGVVTGTGAGTATIAYAMGLGYGSTVVTVNNCPTDAGHSVKDDQQLSVFPNPSQGSFTITLPDINNEAEVTLSNMLGEVVKTATTATLQKSVSMNDIAAGNYVVKVTTGERTYRTKIVVIK